jgi:hypothetical protein
MNNKNNNKAIKCFKEVYEDKMKYSESKEIDAIRRRIQEYIDGVVERNFPKAENTWYPEEVKIYADSDGKLNRITMIQSIPKDEETASKSKSSLLEQSGTIRNIEQKENATIAKVKWLENRDNKKRKFTDYISLLKINKEWKIVSKIFHVESL